MVIAATGVLHHPRYPDIDGLDTFAGTMFHSSRWDHRAQIDGARLGIIGTGSDSRADRVRRRRPRAPT